MGRIGRSGSVGCPRARVVSGSLSVLRGILRPVAIFLFLQVLRRSEIRVAQAFWIYAVTLSVAPALSAPVAMTADAPTSASEALALPLPAGFPSGWDALLAAMRKPAPRDAASGPRAWGMPRLLSAMREQARGLETAVRRRQWDEASGRAADLHRLSLHLIDRIASQPTTDTARLWPALRLEVLVQSLEESCRGENPGRARTYARQIARLLDEMWAPPSSIPRPDIPAIEPEKTKGAARR